MIKIIGTLFLMIDCMAFSLSYLLKSFIIVYHQLVAFFSSNFIPFLLTITSNRVRILGFLSITLNFKVRHKFSMGLRSRIWDDHSQTLLLLSSSYFLVRLAECFGSLPCMEHKRQPSDSSLAESFRFSFRI